MRLPSLPANATSRAMTVTGETTVVVLSDILVGDVWLAAGQSNMAWPLQHTAEDNAVLRRRPVERTLRLYREPPRCSDAPQPANGRWTGSAWVNAKKFSAIGYHFGRALAEEGVPVGIVLAARGGSPIEAWLPPDALPPASAAERRGLLAERDGRRAAFPVAMDEWLAVHEGDLADAPPPPSWPDTAPHLPGCYWDGMISGLHDTSVAGVLWYQGETDATRGTTGYADRLSLLLIELRKAYGRDLPIIVFGLPPLRTEPHTTAIRRAQEAVAAADPNTFLVPAEEPDADVLELHPRPKRGPAERAVDITILFADRD